MINPLSKFIDWFIGFRSILPTPAVAFLSLVLAIFFISSIFRWLT